MRVFDFPAEFATDKLLNPYHDSLERSHLQTLQVGYKRVLDLTLPSPEKRSILAPLTFPNVKNPPPPLKKRSILAPLTFPNVKNNAGKHKSRNSPKPQAGFPSSNDELTSKHTCRISGGCLLHPCPSDAAVKPTKVQISRKPCGSVLVLVELIEPPINDTFHQLFS